nr:cytosolic carboxypeptidase 4-like isoform X1 [Cherax quadricarinatus]
MSSVIESSILVSLNCSSHLLLFSVANVSPRLAAIIRANGQNLQALLNCFFESNVIRLLRESGLQRVLAILDAWEKIERRHQVKVIKAILGTLSHVCDSKHGRKAVMSLNGMEIAQRFIQTCPADKKFDSNLASATNVFLKCVSKGELPVSSIRSAFTFQVPNKADSEASSDVSHKPTSGLDGDSSEDEGDDEVDEDEEDFELSRDFKGIDLISEYFPQRPRMEELLKLEPLFPELNNFHVPDVTRMKEAVPHTRKAGSSTPKENREHYLQASNAPKSLINFVKVAYPDMVAAFGSCLLEKLYEKDRKVCRWSLLLQYLIYFINAM